MLIAIVTFIIIILIILELATFFTYGRANFLKSRGVYLLEQEFVSDSRLNTIDYSIISLFESTELKGSFVTNTPGSWISMFPYYLQDKGDNCYLVVRWSKAYYLVKQRYKDLEYQKKPRHLKF